MAYVVKIKYEDTLRRFTFEGTPRHEDLSFGKLDARVRDLFKFSAQAEIRLTYVDSDGDLITMGDDQDLLDAIHLQGLSPLRLTVEVINPGTPSAADADACPAEVFLTQENRRQRLRTITSVIPVLRNSISSGSAGGRPPTKAVPALPTPAQSHVIEAYGMTLFQCDRRDVAEPENGTRIFHLRVQCDICGMNPIAGPRYKSTVKYDYDLCQACFDKEGSPAEYTRIDRPLFRPPNLHSVSSGRMRCPALNSNYHSARHSSMGGPYGGRSDGRSRQGPVHQTNGAPFGGKLDARFVTDVTFLDGTALVSGTPFTKIWRLRNSGTVSWEPKTRLVHVGGDDLGSFHNVMLELPENGLAPAQEVEVAVDFIAPQKPGRYVSHWRLALPDGPKFGHRVWVLIQVVPADDVPVIAKQDEEPVVEMPLDDLDAFPPILLPNTTAAVGKQDVEDEVDIFHVEEEEDRRLGFVPEAREDGKRHEEDAVEMPLDEAIAITNLLNSKDRSSLSRNEFVNASHEELASKAVRETTVPKLGLNIDLNEPFSGLDLEDVHMETDVKEKLSPAIRAAPDTAPPVAPATPSAASPSPPPAPPSGPPATPADEEVVEEQVLSPESSVVREDVMSVESGELGGGFSMVEMPSGIADSLGSTASSTPKEATTSAEAVQSSVEEKFVDEFGTTDAERTNPGALSAKLEAMGFGDRKLNVELLVKNKLDLRRTLDDLFAAAEWDPILEELEEMGFYDFELNRRLMFKNNGSVKRVVKELVQMYKEPTRGKGKQAVST